MGRPKKDVVESNKLDLSGVHIYRKGKGLDYKLVGTYPYVRIKVQAYPVPVFIQHGKFFFENGEELTEIPELIQAEVDKLSPEIKAEIGV